MKSLEKRSIDKDYDPLTLKDVVEILRVYDLEHTRFPHNYLAEANYDIPRVTGLVIDDAEKILVCSDVSTKEKRISLIHELLHCRHHMRGDLKTSSTSESIVEKYEKKIDKYASQTYELLYGHKP